MSTAKALRLRHLIRPALFGTSTALTLAIPLLAVNAQVARTYFPTADVDLDSAGRQPNIVVRAADGTELGTRGSDLGEPIDLRELPPYLIDSFLATEDRNFFHHPGFDPTAMVRAAVRNYEAGDVVQGGSTITQQLVKNLFLSGEQTFSRKFEELHLALWLEARLTKQEILELYLNRIYLGANTYGIDAAAQAYFSKAPADLTLAESAILAGLPKAPSALAPHANYDGALERSHEVIGNLLEAKRIDELTARMAMMFPPELHLKDRSAGGGYFLDHAAAELKRLLPDATEDLIVITTLDAGAQKAAEEAVAAQLDDVALARGVEQAALIAYDRDGGIVAMIGGKNYADSQFNRATQAKRQPGSAFKPFIFLAALEAGFDQDSLFIDRAVQVEGWEPSNYKERYLGAVRLREALARSSNTTTVQLTEAVGRETVIETGRRLGFEGDMAPHPSIALGVFETPLDEMTAAYLPFANGGIALEPYAIKEVRTRRGELLYTRSAPPANRVMSPSSAERMTDLLQSVTVTGTGSAARVEGHAVAGKTGTTNGWRDAWFVGYSAHLTAGVWVGNDDNREMNEVSGATYPARIFSAFMTGAHSAMALEPQPLDDDIYAHDRDLAELATSYAGLQLDLQDRIYGSGVYSDLYGDDPIRGILGREERRERLTGRVAGNDEYVPSSSVPGAKIYTGPQVTGKVAGSPDED
ncbi:PBP1A family penicillin-binding protein [Parvularcula sp. ZS-1/3]|uniref:PBP1A family penicillin-binding protein n=1 Tax=Parvularcula mediterranea TaxID=2732508 RepID=A0A7Y3RNR8_9PROT|nr:PBP1A family penicillin-binding protein [Parvularcula mediterranea]